MSHKVDCKCMRCRMERREFTGKNNPMYGKGLSGKNNGMYGRKGSKCYQWNSSKFNCLNCGKEYYRKQFHVKNKKGIHFCSIKCFSEHHRIEKICPKCKKKYSTPKSINAAFCSLECFNSSRPELMKGEGNPRWLGGISFKPYGIEFSKELKSKIRFRDNFTCRFCGKREGEKVLDVHHVDFDKTNNHPSNLITLCRSCHGKTGTNRGYWTELFREIADEDFCR